MIRAMDAGVDEHLVPSIMWVLGGLVELACFVFGELPKVGTERCGCIANDF